MPWSTNIFCACASLSGADWGMAFRAFLSFNIRATTSASCLRLVEPNHSVAQEVQVSQQIDGSSGGNRPDLDFAVFQKERKEACPAGPSSS